MKQAIVVRTDIGMGTGKLAAQVAHASLKSYETASDAAQKQWKTTGQKKIVLKGSNEQMLQELAHTAQIEGLPHALIRDAGHTQVDPGTLTALAIGPADEHLVDKIMGELSLL